MSVLKSTLVDTVMLNPSRFLSRFILSLHLFSSDCENVALIKIHAEPDLCIPGGCYLNTCLSCLKAWTVQCKQISIISCLYTVSHPVTTGDMQFFFVFLNIIHNIQELELLGMYIVILFLHSLLGFIKL